MTFYYVSENKPKTKINSRLKRVYVYKGMMPYIEDENERLLFDTGYSDAFIRNAQAMNIDLIHKSIPVHEVGVGLKIEIE